MGLLRGPADGQRAARAPTTCSRACSRTSTRAFRRCAATAWSARAAGTATACRSRSPSNRSSASPRKAEIEETIGIERFNAECRESVFAYLEEWNRLTERIGFWLDLDARLPHARRELHRVGLVGARADRRARAAVRGPQGRPLLPALRDDAVLARGRARLQGRGRPERVPEAAGAAAARSGCWSGRRRRGRCRATSRWRSSPTATYARVRVGDEMLRARRGRVEAVLGEQAPRSSSASAARSWRERYGAYEGPIFAASDREPAAAADPRRRLRDDRGRHRHRAPRAGVRRGRLPRGRGRRRCPSSPTSRARCTTRCARTAPTTSACATATGARYEGRFVKDTQLTAELIEDLRERGLLLRVAGLRALLPALLALRQRR